MKKKVLVSLVILLLGASLFAVDFRVSLGQDTTASIEFNKTRGSSVNTQFNFNINAELDMNFKRGHGMVVEINPYADGSVRFGVGVGYAYETWIANNVSLLASVGPRFDFGSGGVGFEIFAAVDFDIHVTSSLFVRVGTGVRMDFGEFGSNFGDSFNITIPLPAVAVGWRF